MSAKESTRQQLSKWCVVSGIWLLAWISATGCAFRRSATFLPSEEVRQIRVSQNIAGRHLSDVSVLKDPARTAELHAFLAEHADGWKPIWTTPWAGEYSILLESDDSYQSIFVLGNAIQTHSEGTPIQRELSPESRQRLLALLGLSPELPAESLHEATLASHSSNE